MGNIDILEKLEEYSKAGYVPMHMPGGKRNTEYASTSELDITEIDGFDNMHNADGIIKNASDRAAKLYGADKTLMLVNGSTAGILSAICGATKRKGKIIVARNCHVSVYNALIMAQLEPVYVIPEVDNDTGIYRGLSLEQIRKCVENNRDAQAVIITSPTYEGVVSEIREIASYMHEKGIGVILDWVPAHFPKDAHGLANFDGSCVYEYADPRKGEHPDWGTKVFDYSKNEVANFLIANGMFWVDKFHIDGLRVDAVASMLYLDYGRTEGNWVPNKYGDNGNLEAISFLKHFNSMLKKRFPQAITIAEESTAWPMVSGDPDNGECLGFTFKWNMGWMHDFLEYMKLDPYFRKFNHSKMTFSLMYAYSENFILVLSHDEVVHLKCSMLGKMPGDREDKFKNLKLAYAYMCGHPGKKLLFMGQEFGQWNEWSEKRALDWYLLEDESHTELKDFTKKCLKLNKNYPCLYATDYSSEGFRWINANDKDNSVLSFMRISPDGKKNLLFVLNFTPVERDSFRIGVPFKTKYKLVLGDNEADQKKTLTAVKGDCDGYPQSLLIDLHKYGIAVYEFNGDVEAHKPTII